MKRGGVIPIYNYTCRKCDYVQVKQLKVADRDISPNCPACYSEGSVSRDIGNSGGFRLGTKGSVSWAKGGYSTTLGDAQKAERS